LSSEAAYLSFILTFLVKSLRVIMTSSSGCVFKRWPNVKDGSAILSPCSKRADYIDGVAASRLFSHE
jgi:hypothetical protein